MKDEAGTGYSNLFKRIVMTALAVASLAAIAVVRLFFEPSVAEATSPILEAIFIALFLALTVDPLLKKEFFKEASADIFLFWLGYPLPEPINKFLRSFALQTTLIRTDCKLEWELTDLGNGRVAVFFRLSFSLMNLTKSWQSYRQEASVFDALPGEKNRVLRMKGTCHEWTANYDWEPRDFRELPGGIFAGPDCTIPPEPKPSGPGSGEYKRPRFTIEYSSEHNTSGTDTWLAGSPYLDVEVSCEPAGHFEFTTNMANFDKTADGKWASAEVLLENHGFTLIWRPRNALTGEGL